MSAGPLGILGGTFDPIHYGHLRLAEELADALKLEEVRFIPSGTPPHRAAPATTASHRLAMASLATAGNARFTVDAREVHRSGPGYTFDTLAELRAQEGRRRPLVLLLGADAFLELTTWHRWGELPGLAHLVVAHRPGFAFETWRERMPPPLAREYGKRLLAPALDVHRSPSGGIAAVPTTALDISATVIRRLLRDGASPRYLLPETVLDYIRANHLYRE